MIIDLKRSIDQRWLLMSGAIFILRWSCYTCVHVLITPHLKYRVSEAVKDVPQAKRTNPWLDFLYLMQCLHLYIITCISPVNRVWDGIFKFIVQGYKWNKLRYNSKLFIDNAENKCFDLSGKLWQVVSLVLFFLFKATRHQFTSGLLRIPI